MPDTVDRLSEIADRLIENSELVRFQMMSVTRQLQEILLSNPEETSHA